MIIDYILDTRDDPSSYDAHDFYEYVAAESSIFHFDYIASALDCGTNDDVRKALCRYIDDNEYNPKIKDFVNSFVWVD